MHRLYLREHRKRLGISAPRMAQRLNMERESLLRLERSAQNIDWAKAVAYAQALGVSPARLLKPPNMTSLDEPVENEPAEVQAMAADIVKRIIRK
jgi:transcriptional regulator with XRE-family HTH domain